MATIHTLSELRPRTIDQMYGSEAPARRSNIHTLDDLPPIVPFNGSLTAQLVSLSLRLDEFQSRVEKFQQATDSLGEQAASLEKNLVTYETNLIKIKGKNSELSDLHKVIKRESDKARDNQKNLVVDFLKKVWCLITLQSEDSSPVSQTQPAPTSVETPALPTTEPSPIEIIPT